MTLDLGLLYPKTDYWYELSSKLDHKFDKNLIKRAFDFALNAHLGQKRESGEPYISHPVWIAKVIAQLGVGQEAIIAALLHDCVEDTPINLTDIASEFGDEVALLVEGLTEIKKAGKDLVIHQTNLDVFRKFLFSSVNDVRVLIIRIVDKLHNGLTIDSLPQKRQLKYAHRVMGVYGPIAEYVGLHYFKRLLEDISFKILHPKESAKLEILLQKRKTEEERAVVIVKKTIDDILTANKIKDYEIQARIKGLYSTYLKTKARITQRELFDRVGIRVITNNLNDCYTVLGLLHASYEYLPEEFDDYISSPKANGYRSIQTTINWRNKLTVEIQIRTKEMHEFNEFGPASHIAYKLSKNNNRGLGYEWVKDLVKWQKTNNQVENYTIKVLKNFIYVFTPKGDTIQLPKGSTALDFAYRIHTDIGDHCMGVKINKLMAKIDQELANGDLVDILINKKNNVNKNWLNIVKTQWAKEHIRKIVNANQ